MKPFPWMIFLENEHIFLWMSTGNKNIFYLVVSNIFYFHPYLGKIPILTNIFQMG